MALKIMAYAGFEALKGDTWIVLHPIDTFPGVSQIKVGGRNGGACRQPIASLLERIEDRKN